jgi:hypothetical protein
MDSRSLEKARHARIFGEAAAPKLLAFRQPNLRLVRRRQRSRGSTFFASGEGLIAQIVIPLPLRRL